MKNFASFLESPGGNLLILCIFVLLSGITVNKVHYSDQIDTVMISIFSGFSGALLQALSSTVRNIKAATPPDTTTPGAKP